jgi:S-adenosylmethionine synthetase
LVDVANIQGKYDLTIDDLVEELELRTPFYEALCVEGVFGVYNVWERMGFKKELPANNG